MKKNELKENRKRQTSLTAPQKLASIGKRLSSNEKASLKIISHQDEGIITLLYEYFIKNNFLDTLNSFQKDCHEKGFKPNNKFLESFSHEIIEAFETGNREVFFARFGQFLPISMRNKDGQIMKLEFFLHVYFFVFSIHPLLGKKKNIDLATKQSFINYLEGRGATLAKSSEFLNYYALAYLPKPQENQNFKTIFTKEWISELKKQLIYLVDNLYPKGKSPELISVYDQFIEKNEEKNSEKTITEPDDELEIEEEIEPEESQAYLVHNNPVGSRAQQNIHTDQLIRYPNSFEASDRERESMNLKIAELEEEKNELIKVIENIKKKYQSLQCNYKDFTDAAQNTLMESQSKWFKITQEFYNMASSLKDVCTRQQDHLTQDDSSIVDKIGKKLSKYESFVKMNIEDLISENVDFSLFERPEHDLSVDMVRKNNEERSQYLIQLDFDKVKATLGNKNPELDNEKCNLLEALKSRLTKTRGVMPKREVVLSFALNDIFDQQKGDSLIKTLLNSNNQTVLMKVAQFLNAFAKDYYGRNYLSCESIVINTMEVLLNNENKNIEENVIVLVSFLQQLSVRTNSQQMMIDGDIIKWIVRKLKNERETMSDDLMQYSLATIINLLLKKEGLKKSEEIKEEILTTLIDLMEIEVVWIKEYVHGAIYPLFHKKVYREKAKEYGLEANIKFLLENSDSEHITNQLNYLQKQLLREDEEIEEESEEEYDTDEITDEEFGPDFEFETEIDTIEGLSGEELLMKKYPLTGPDAIKQLNLIREEAEMSLKNKSVYVPSNHSERPSTNNPKMPMRKNISNNNSVYSNKSSSRVLRSELMNRSQINKNENKDRLDTVHPDNSEKEMSIRDFIDDPQGDGGRQSPMIDISDPLIPRNKDDTLLDNNSFNNKQQNTRPHKSLKSYENSDEYKQGFITRSKLVRTPPEK